MSPGSQVHRVLEKWKSGARQVSATLTTGEGERRCCVGRVVSLSDSEVVISDAAAELHVPYAAADDALVIHLTLTTTITLTFGGGGHAFLAASKRVH